MRVWNRFIGFIRPPVEPSARMARIEEIWEKQNVMGKKVGLYLRSIGYDKPFRFSKGHDLSGFDLIDMDDTQYRVEYNEIGEVQRVTSTDTGEDITEKIYCSMKSLVHYFSTQLEQELDQMIELEKELTENGEVTFYGQIFNQNEDLTSREMTALCRALENDSYIVAKSDYETGLIRLQAH